MVQLLYVIAGRIAVPPCSEEQSDVRHNDKKENYIMLDWKQKGGKAESCVHRLLCRKKH